jgi:tetrapyrrole methylase family protein/MazG family protein
MTNNEKLTPAKDAGLAAAFSGLYDIVARLRAPDGCPWDKEQTPLSLRSDIIEETFECVEALGEQNPEHIKEELGDIFLLVTMLAYMHEQQGLFSVTDVLTNLSEKLVRRHPHVFAGEKVKDSAEVLVNWARIKVEQEGRKPKDSTLDEVRAGFPPLERAYKLQKKAAKVGFDWFLVRDVYAKLQEEMGEVQEAAQMLEDAPEDKRDAAQDHLEDELGDVLFVAVNLCRVFGVDPSVALDKTNRKFTKRFKYVEQKMKESGQEMKQDNLEVMDKFWTDAKNTPATVER